MRISRDETAKREAFAKDLFTKDVNLSIPKANEALKAQFGQNMRAVRLYEIRDLVKSQAPTAPEEATAPAQGEKVTVAGRKPTRATILPEIIPIDSAKDATVLRKSLDVLRKRGLTNLSVPFATADWAVVAPAR